MEEQYDLSFIDSFQWSQPNKKVKEILASLLEAEVTTGDTTMQANNKGDYSEEIEYIYLAAAKNPQTPASVLQALSKLGSNRVAMHVAENPHTAVKTLNQLAFHQAAEVRTAVGENAQTPIETIMALAKDESPDIRFALAENHNQPLDLLQTLTGDDNPYVAHRAQRTIRRLQAANREPSLLSPNINPSFQRHWHAAN